MTHDVVEDGALILYENQCISWMKEFNASDIKCHKNIKLARSLY